MRHEKAAVAAIGVLGLSALMIGLSLASDDSAGAVLKAAPAQFDAGTVAEGKAVEVRVSIQNIWSTPVEITNVRTS